MEVRPPSRFYKSNWSSFVVNPVRNFALPGSKYDISNGVKKILPLLAVFFLSCLFLLVGCAKEIEEKAGIGLQVSGPVYGDAIVVGSIGDASTLVPIVASDSASHNIIGLIFNGLVKYDKDINLVGDLASRWEVSED